VGKHGRAGQATYDKVAHAHCMLDDSVCRHTLRMVKIYCFSTETMTTRKPLIVTLYAHCLSCLILKV